MLIKYTEELYAQMEAQLENINGSLKEAIQNLTESLFCITTTLNHLKKFIQEHPFKDPEDEIDFFKNIKPRFYCWYIYVIELYQILSAVPSGTDQMIRDFFMDELKIINRYFTIHQFYYQYFLRSETALDDSYFLRVNLVPFPTGSEQTAVDPEFSTNQDYMFSKFRAYEMLRSFLIRRLKLLYQNPDNVFIAELLAGKRKCWSGDKVELIEVAYGIYYTHRLNEGKAEIGDVIEWLEDSLQIDLSQAYRMFLDIRRRKTLSYTKYLDEMRDSIHKHIDETNRYKPKTPKRQNM
ncbi:RteC domain-containing protein [Daejeonella sp. JGW-45]|uniref:RteC domain-containing protein n=1 Tax=Daejeonella sp. JGW-45 TaxID=3034148 RepID=UPI0023EC3FF6|nr:RteC domain-containing protein [Daejeonella sp. JGW-45]